MNVDRNAWVKIAVSEEGTDAITVEMTASAGAKARAEGRRGDSIAAVADLWALTNLMAIITDEETGAGWHEFVFAYDRGEFDNDKIDGKWKPADAKIPNFVKFGAASGEFMVQYKAGTGAIMKMLKDPKTCDYDAAKEKLKALFYVLEKIVEGADK